MILTLLGAVWAAAGCSPGHGPTVAGAEPSVELGTDEPKQTNLKVNLRFLLTTVPKGLFLVALNAYRRFFKLHITSNHYQIAMIEFDFP